MSNSKNEIIQDCINQLGKNDIDLNKLDNHLSRISPLARSVEDEFQILDSLIEETKGRIRDIHKSLEGVIIDDEPKELFRKMILDLQIKLKFMSMAIPSIPAESLLRREGQKLLSEILGRNHSVFMDLVRVLKAGSDDEL